MSITSEQLDTWFTYHPCSRSSVKFSLYASIREGELRAHEVVRRAEVEFVSFDEVNETFRGFALDIMANVPTSADQTVAVRSVRLARMMTNEYLARKSANGQECPDFLRQADMLLVEARMWASSALACDGV